ncbi:MAG: hypothetical protein LBL04_14050 [Bacteroidales bacterium]|jgi:hypothetical protein|nr:hypothetical protein [Bacteroidales bacterium]
MKMETLKASELVRLLNIDRKKAERIIRQANSDALCRKYAESPDMSDEEREKYKEHFDGRDEADIIPHTAVIRSSDPRYHGRHILEAVIEGLKKGLSLRVKQSAATGGIGAVKHFIPPGERDLLERKIKLKKYHR